jgi:hypothetical protein
MAHPSDIFLTRMTAAYLECAEWTDCGPDSEELQDHSGFAPEARAAAEEACADFLSYCEGEDLGDTLRAGWDPEQAGHDFWLSRNGHGAGFFDRGEPGANELQCAAKTFGEAYLYLDDDNKLQFS